jgi:hypothetical protein
MTQKPLARSSLLKRRQQERGVAIFVVVLALTLLTGVGVWSMRTTSLVDQASGYARAAAQTQYLAEMGIQTSSAVLSLEGQASTADRIARGKVPGIKPDDCQGAKTLEYCRVFELSDIDTVTKDNAVPGVSPGSGQAVFDDTAGGSFNPMRSAVAISLLQGEFRVEMTDAQDAYMAGTEVGKSGYKRVALTSRGLLRPRPKTSAGITENENRSAVQLGLRAHVLIGPTDSGTK